MTDIEMAELERRADGGDLAALQMLMEELPDPSVEIERDRSWASRRQPFRKELILLVAIRRELSRRSVHELEHPVIRQLIFAYCSLTKFDT